MGKIVGMGHREKTDKKVNASVLKEKDALIKTLTAEKEELENKLTLTVAEVAERDEAIKNLTSEKEVAVAKVNELENKLKELTKNDK